MAAIDYSDKIPNNVNLSEDKTLQRALENWQPNYIDWWKDMGPEGSNDFDVYLRTAVSVDPQGWAQFGHVKMPDYRWGIFLNPRDEGRKVNFGEHKGEAAWQEVPGEHRANLRRIIVTQGPSPCSSVVRVTRTIPVFWVRSTRRPPTGSRSTCSPTSPIATASSSCARWPKAASTRWPARPSSC